MACDVPEDLAEKAAIMREFGRRLAAGELTIGPFIVPTVKK
jgi:hypothetical protein